MKLIRLSRPAKLNSYVNTVSLPSSCPTGTRCLITGWGNTSNMNKKNSTESTYPDRLRATDEVWQPNFDFPIFSTE